MMDWLANLLIVISWKLTGDKNRWCFVLLGAGEVIYVWIGFDSGLHGLAAISGACVAFCAFNWVKWGKS
jgi:hypothetical protein